MESVNVYLCVSSRFVGNIYYWKEFLIYVDLHVLQAKKKKKQLYLRRVTHNNNSTDELVAPDSKSTISRFKMYSYKTDRQLYWNLS